MFINDSCFCENFLKTYTFLCHNKAVFRKFIFEFKFVNFIVDISFLIHIIKVESLKTVLLLVSHMGGGYYDYHDAFDTTCG